MPVRMPSRLYVAAHTASNSTSSPSLTSTSVRSREVSVPLTAMEESAAEKRRLLKPTARAPPSLTSSGTLKKRSAAYFA